MNADPVEGFFSGFGSCFGRMVVGFGAVAGGAAVCFLPTTFNPASNRFYWSSHLLYEWIYLLPFMLAGWADLGCYGLWFLVGLGSVLTLITSYFAFVQDIFYPSKQAFYATFAAASVYYFPITISEYRWVAAVTLFALVTTCYWYPSTVRDFLLSIVERLKFSKPGKSL